MNSLRNRDLRLKSSLRMTPLLSSNNRSDSCKDELEILTQ